MEQMLQLPGVHSTIGHPCSFGLTTSGPRGELLPAKKASRFISSSPDMVARLHMICPRDRKHQELISGRPAAAAFDNIELIDAILRGIGDRADQGAEATSTREITHQFYSAMAGAANTGGDTHVTRELDVRQKALHGKLGKLHIRFRCRDGTLEMSELKCNDCDADEHTNSVILKSRFARP